MTVEGRRVVLPTQADRARASAGRSWASSRSPGRACGTSAGASMYRLDVDADEERFAPARYRTYFGVRHVRKTADGQVLLNGRPLKLRGVSLHEDSPVVGSAWRAPQRAARAAVDRRPRRQRGARPLPAAPGADGGAGPARDHGLGPGAGEPGAERPDGQGVGALAARWRPTPRRCCATAATRRCWPSRSPTSCRCRSRRPRSTTRARPPPRCARWTRRGWWPSTAWPATTRPTTAIPVFREVDAIGANEYFGWYRGAFPPHPPAGTDDLAGYLDTLHRKQPHAALFLTEFGAEANRRGPAARKGTYAFQSRYLTDHVRIAARHPHVTGSMVVEPARLPRLPRLERRQPAARPAVQHQGPDRHRRARQARLPCGPAPVAQRPVTARKRLVSRHFTARSRHRHMTGAVWRCPVSHRPDHRRTATAS